MADECCSKSAGNKNKVLSFSVNEDSDDDVENMPDIFWEDDYIDCLAVTMVLKSLKALRRN